MTCTLKRLWAALLALLLVVELLPAQTLALSLPEPVEALTLSGTNPLYAGLIPETPAQPATPDLDALLHGEVPYCATFEETVEHLRDCMKARQETIQYTFSEYFDINAVIDAAMVHTGVPTEGDYLAFQWGGWEASISGSRATLTFTYYDTAAQEQEMDAWVDSWLDQHSHLQTATDYEKVVGVYDWICDNVVYDYANLNDDSYTLKYTGYAAAINGTSVCQGYAVLLYRLLLELGVDCRIISGFGGGGAHSWNIIHLNGYYYNADATWDAGTYQYYCFLECNDNFTDHTPKDEYLTDEFQAAYPMAPADYDPKDPAQGPATPTLPDDTPQEPPVKDTETLTGVCGDNLTWTLEQGTLTISGTGDMWNYYDTNQPEWEPYRDQVTALVVEEGVTGLGFAAFDCHSRLVSVSLPNTLDNIQCHAFYDCPSLTQIQLPDSLTYMGNYVFAYCISLQEIVIPDAVTQMGEYVFAYCSSLTRAQLGNGLRTIGVRCFLECMLLTDVTIGASLTAIPNGTFGNCHALAQIVIPRSVEVVGRQAFAFCRSLHDIYFQGDAPTFEDKCFQDVVATAWYDPNTGGWSPDMYGYGGRITWSALNSSQEKEYPITGSCGSGTTWVLEADGTLTISGDGRVEYCPAELYIAEIVTVVIEEGIYSLCNSAFEGYYNLRQVTLPSTLNSLGNRAFYACTALEEVTLPENLQLAGDYVFTYCTSLKKVDLGLLWYPGDYMFAGCSTLAEVINSPELRTISYGMFADCVSLQRIEIHTQLEGLYPQAFANCTGLTDIVFDGKYPQSIGAYGIDENGYYYLDNNCFSGVTATVWYDPALWIESYFQDYGGDLTWKPHAVTSVELVTGATSPYCVVGQEPCLVGTSVKVTYESGAVRIREAADLNITCDTSKAGIVTATAEYQGYTLELTLYVHEEGQRLELPKELYPESDHEYAEDVVDAQTITSPGAISLLLVFDLNCYLGDGDTVYIYDKAGNLAGSFTRYYGKGLMVTVPGDTATIVLESDYSENNYGYSLHSVLADYVTHTGTSAEHQAASCTQAGYCGVAYCDICRAEIAAHTLPQTEHDWDEGQTMVEATDSTAGQILYTCRDCGQTKLTDVAAGTHVHTPRPQIVSDPTFEYQGILQCSCSECGRSLGDCDLPALNSMDYEVTVLHEANCQGMGMAQYTWRVDLYGEVTMLVFPPATDHHYSATVTQDPTEAQTGTLTVKCDDCSERFEVTLPALNDTDYTVHVLTPATCSSEGVARYIWKDTAYGTVTVEATLPTTDHSYQAHIVEPTCTNDGCIQYTCTVCGHGYQEPGQPATGHSWDSWVEVEAPTCTKTGLKTRHCLQCDAEESTAIPALGHIGDGDTCDRCLETMGLWGDANKDGKVSISDAIHVLRKVAGLVKDTDDFDEAMADVDGNGRVGISDAIQILRKIAGLIDKFPAEE